MVDVLDETKPFDPPKGGVAVDATWWAEECIDELYHLLGRSVSLMCLHLLGCEDSCVEDVRMTCVPFRILFMFYIREWWTIF